MLQFVLSAVATVQQLARYETFGHVGLFSIFNPHVDDSVPVPFTVATRAVHQLLRQAVAL